METIRPEQLKAIDIPGDGQIPSYEAGTEKFEWVTVSGIEGAIALTDLTDVNLADLEDDDVLVYDLATDKWINATAPGGAVALDDLTDVTIVDPIDGDALIYDEDTNTWINAAVSGTSALNGNGATNQVAIWSGTHNLYGDTGLTWNPDTNTLTCLNIIAAKPATTAGIQLDPSSNVGNYTISLSPGSTILTGNRRVSFPNEDLIFSRGGTLTLQGYTLTVSDTGSCSFLNVANTFTKTAIFQRDANSTAAFTIKDKDSNTVLDADTTNQRISIDRNFPAFTLDVLFTNPSTAVNEGILRLAHNSTGTPASGFGTSILWYLESTTTEDNLVGYLGYMWTTATHATRKARGIWSVYDTAEREGIRIEANGSAAQIGFLGANASPRSTGWTIANLSSDKSYDADATSIDELADVVGTLIEEFKTKGLLGA
jgi:hypothetical protein